MGKIQALDDQAVKQLKASIIIVTLEQCLVELIKNALDAGATTINATVDIDQCMIQVEDNGIGILSTDLPRLAQRHFTSKCHSLADLHGTRTFGYRGEVLASLAAMSILHITTRHESSTETYKATWKDGRLIQLLKSTDTQRPGTTVLVPSLFYKLPVRQKSQNTNLDTLKHAMTLFALTFPQVNFTLVDKKRKSRCMVTKKCSSSFGTFQSLFDQRMAQTIKAYSIHDNQIRIQGYFGDGVPTKVHQYIYVNRHYIPSSSSDLYKVVSSTMKDYSSERLAEEQIGKGKESDHHPFLIKIEYPCITSYDIPYLAAHTTYPQLSTLLQRLVLQYLRSIGRFEPRQSIPPPRKKQHVSTTSSLSSIRTKLPGLNLEPSNSSLARDSNTPPYQKTAFNDYPDLASTTNMIDRSRLRMRPDPILDRRNIISTAQLPPSTSTSTLSSQQSSLGFNSTCTPPPSKTISSSSSSLPTEYHSNHSYGLQAPKKIQRQDLDSAKVLAQVDRKWIVCLLDRTLLLIDQHAADERVKLETMLDMDLDVRFLQPYLVISTTEHDLDLATSHRKTLQHWGIHVETNRLNQQHHHHGGSPHFTAQIKASPHFSTKQQPQYQLVITRLPHLILERCVIDPQLLSDLIHNYLHALEGRTLTSSVCPPGMMDMLKSKACRSAIMFNDPLTMEQCTGLIKSLAKCRFPFQCAHGRPSVVPLVTMHARQQPYNSRPIRWDGFVK